MEMFALEARKKLRFETTKGQLTIKASTGSGSTNASVSGRGSSSL